MLPKKKPLRKKLIKKSTVLSKPSKTFDMTPCAPVLIAPKFEGLEIRGRSKLTPAIVDATIKKANKDSGWCSYYCSESSIIDGKYCSANYTACHAGLSNDNYRNTFYLDVVKWSPLTSEEQVENAKQVYNMLVSKDSPWAEALKNGQLLYSEDGRLLAVYFSRVLENAEGNLRLLANFLIALRCVTEHRSFRDALKEGRGEFKTWLAWFIEQTILAGAGHNWYSRNGFNMEAVEKLFEQKHSLEGYQGKDSFTSYCNDVYKGKAGASDPVTKGNLLTFEKEKNYV